MILREQACVWLGSSRVNGERVVGSKLAEIEPLGNWNAPTVLVYIFLMDEPYKVFGRFSCRRFEGLLEMLIFHWFYKVSRSRPVASGRRIAKGLCFYKVFGRFSTPEGFRLFNKK